MDERNRALIIVAALAQSQWVPQAVAMPNGTQATMPAFPEDSNQRVTSEAAAAIGALRSACGLSGDVSITTNGHTTTVRVGK